MSVAYFFLIHAPIIWDSHKTKIKYMTTGAALIWVLRKSHSDTFTSLSAMEPLQPHQPGRQTARYAHTYTHTLTDTHTQTLVQGSFVVLKGNHFLLYLSHSDQFLLALHLTLEGKFVGLLLCTSLLKNKRTSTCRYTCTHNLYTSTSSHSRGITVMVTYQSNTGRPPGAS